MKIVHIVGRSGNGKTTLILELIGELQKRGLQVGTLKHSGHAHELEKPGKDSYRHRKAGGNPAAIATTDQIAVFLPRQPDEDPFNKLASLFDPCDIILVEGYIDGPGIKLEVWRAETHTDPIFHEQEGIHAVVSDDAVETDLPVWPRKNVEALVGRMLSL
ncbi:MAG: molybdopterin-guanine dinucleotide biosynthesis protein B [Thermodesulfobacteriota bacterium]|nr:molybdopterin-guanine dinucleotide biosynthesis protein B [Thermodesulfobacteriota bacterium]